MERDGKVGRKWAVEAIAMAQASTYVLDFAKHEILRLAQDDTGLWAEALRGQECPRYNYGR